MLRLTFSLPFKGNQLSVSKDSKTRCVRFEWRADGLDFMMWLAWFGLARFSEQTRMNGGGLETQKQRPETNPILKMSQSSLISRTLDFSRRMSVLAPDMMRALMGKLYLHRIRRRDQGPPQSRWSGIIRTLTLSLYPYGTSLLCQPWWDQLYQQGSKSQALPFSNAALFYNCPRTKYPQSHSAQSLGLRRKWGLCRCLS